MTIKDPEHHFITSHGVIVLGNNKGEKSCNQIWVICTTEVSAQDRRSRKLLMVFIMCNAAENSICLHLEALEKI